IHAATPPWRPCAPRGLGCDEALPPSSASLEKALRPGSGLPAPPRSPPRGSTHPREPQRVARASAHRATPRSPGAPENGEAGATRGCAGLCQLLVARSRGLGGSVEELVADVRIGRVARDELHEAEALGERGGEIVALERRLPQ